MAVWLEPNPNKPPKGEPVVPVVLLVPVVAVVPVVPVVASIPPPLDPLLEPDVDPPLVVPVPVVPVVPVLPVLPVPDVDPLVEPPLVVPLVVAPVELPVVPPLVLPAMLDCVSTLAGRLATKSYDPATVSVLQTCADAWVAMNRNPMLNAIFKDPSIDFTSILHGEKIVLTSSYSLHTATATGHPTRELPKCP